MVCRPSGANPSTMNSLSGGRWKAPASRKCRSGYGKWARSGRCLRCVVGMRKKKRRAGGMSYITQRGQESRLGPVIHHRVQLALQSQARVRLLHAPRHQGGLLKWSSEGLAALRAFLRVGAVGRREGQECATAEEVWRKVGNYCRRYKDYFCCRLPWQWNQRDFVITRSGVLYLSNQQPKEYLPFGASFRLYKGKAQTGYDLGILL